MLRLKLAIMNESKVLSCRERSIELNAAETIADGNICEAKAAEPAAETVEAAEAAAEPAAEPAAETAEATKTVEPAAEARERRLRSESCG